MGLKEAIKKYQERKAGERAQREEIRITQKTALQQERLRQAQILGIQQAKIEREEKVRRIRQQMRTGTGGGFLRGITKRINIAAENLGYARDGSILGTGFGPGPAPRAPRISKKKKGKAGPQIITVKGKRFQMIETKRKKRKRRKAPAPQSYNPFGTSF